MRSPRSLVLAALSFPLAASMISTSAAPVRALPLDPSVPFFGAKFEPHGVYHIAQGETQSTVVWDCWSRPGFPCSQIGTISKYQDAAGVKPIGVLHYVTAADAY